MGVAPAEATHGPNAPSRQPAARRDSKDEPVADIPKPTASRLQRPSWKDARLLVGLLLVLTTTALVSLVVSAADDRVAMYAARTPLVPGQRLGPEHLTRVDVQLEDERSRYLSATTPLAPDRFVLREVRAGELVPVSAVGSHAQVTVQPITLTVDAGSAEPLRVGSRVDVYVNPPASGGRGDEEEFTGPELVLEGVSVSSLPKSGSGLGGGGVRGERPVQVMAPRDKIRRIIGEVDRGARVTVVPMAGTPLKVDQ